MPLTPEPARLSTGVPALDGRLGGGLLPGTLTVIVGATGIGKTQLGIQFATAGRDDPREGRPGMIFDMAARGDSQSHADYARRMSDWMLTVQPPDQAPRLDTFFAAPPVADYLHVFDFTGRRVTRRDLEWEDWREWQTQLNARLRTAIAFFYANFIAGKRRVVVDGIEPAERPHESIQFNLFEYVYHQVLRKEPQWVARDLFRETYRHYAAQAAQAVYDPATVACLLLYTSRESMLEELISRRLEEGDVLSNANTLIYMGKVRDGNRIGRSLYVAKHRGSDCSDEILPYEIGDAGVRLV